MPTHVDTPIVGLYDVVSNAAFSAVSSLSASWTVGLYRRLELHLRVDSGSANGYLTFQGLTGETYTRNGFYAAPTAVLTAWAASGTASAWVAQGIASQVADVGIKVWCAANSQKTYQAWITDVSGYQAILSGTCSDTTAPVSGVTVTFTGATSGWFELLGFR